MSDSQRNRLNDRAGDGLAATLPPLEWLPHYSAASLRRDAAAGITLAAYAIPVSLAYATLAGLPPHYGIYCYLVGGAAYALFGTSRQLAVGPTSAIAMLVGSTVAGMAGGDAARAASIASLTALVAAALGVIAWLLRLSGLVSFISETILIGFKAGAALTIAMTQLPKLFGVPGGGDHFFERAAVLCGQLGHTNFLVLGIGLGALAMLFAADRFLPGRPAALFVVALSIVLVSAGGLTAYGVATVGVLPAGLPELTLPSLRLRDVDGVLPLAAACFLLAYVEGVSAARTLAARHGYAIRPRQELLALGAANFATAFVHGFPVAGGLSQSAVNDKAGAQTPLALVFASATIGVCLLFFTGLLRNLPSVVLAAVVLFAVYRLFDVAAMRRLWRIRRTEFAVAAAAFTGVLLLGILKGVLLAVITSLLMLIRAAATPHVAILGRIPGSRRYSDAERHADNELIPGLCIARIESSLLYFNAEHVRNVLESKLKAEPAVTAVICDLSNAPHVDVAGAEMLLSLHEKLRGRDIRFQLVEAHSAVRDVLRAVGLEEQVGYFGRHRSLDSAVAEFEHDHMSEPNVTASSS
jgi:high affinity sulfate transporter 1